MARSYFPRSEFQRLGLSEPAIRVLEKVAEFIDAQAAIAAAQANLASQGNAINAANIDIIAANAAINALDARLDAYDALAPFVRQDQAAAPAYTAYAGQTVSNPPTQAEMQALDNAVGAIGTALALLITRLKAVDALT